MRYIVDINKDKDIFDLSKKIGDMGSIHISLYSNIRNELQDTIIELSEIQKWLNNQKFDGYYPDLKQRIDKLKILQEDLKEI